VTKPPPTATMADRRSRIFWAGALLAGVTLIAYFPALRGGFIWDDDSFLTQNKLIRAGDGLYRMWFTTTPSDFWPVTYSSLWIEWRLWGMHAIGYHSVNLGLHIAESLFLWAILHQLWNPAWRARSSQDVLSPPSPADATAKTAPYVAAFLFAVHPVNVESVAWIAQRKNLMAMLFYLATIWCFLKTEIASPSPIRRSPSEGGPIDQGLSEQAIRPGWYLLSLICFILAMLSKGSVAVLPVVLLGLVAWRRRLSIRDLAWALPYFVVSAVLVLTDMWFQKHGLAVVFRHAGFVERLLGAAAAVWFYLYKALFPINLAFVYPQWRIQAGNPLWWVPLLAGVGLTGMLFRYRASHTRPALFAWGYFCVALVPVMGFTDVYFMKYSLVADHYQHLAIIGVVGLVAAGWGEWEKKAFDRLRPQIAAAAAICALSILTWRQCETYRDAETLYRTTLDRNPESWLAENNLGNVLNTSGRFREAIPHYREALRLKPDLPEAHYNLGLALVNAGAMAEAISHFEQAIQLKPDYADAYNNLGVALAATGRPEEAISPYRKALQLDPDSAVAHFNLGNAFAALGRMDDAIGFYREALRLKSNYAAAHTNLGAVLAQTGRVPEAVAQLREAIRIDPGFANAHEILGQILCAEGQNQEGKAHLAEAARLYSLKSGSGSF
jgi:protein O-mannosyl-transferase